MKSRQVRKVVAPLWAALLMIAVVAGGSAAAGSLITGAQIKDGTLTLKDFKKSERAKLKGPQGLQGVQGASGATGPTGPLGPASGDLTGAYPNPSIAPNAVNSAKVADGSLGSADIGSIGQSDIGAGLTESINFASIPANGCSTTSIPAPSSSAPGDVLFVVPLDGSTGGSGTPPFVSPGVYDNAGVGTIKICNVSGAAYDPAPEDYRVFTVRP